MRVYVINGSRKRNGLNIGREIGSYPITRGRWVGAVFKPFLKPFMPQAPAVPGSSTGKVPG